MFVHLQRRSKRAGMYRHSGRAMTRAADPPRSRRVLRLIALERAGRGLLLLAAGVYLLFHLNDDFGRLGERVMRAIELDPRRPFFHRIVAYLHHLHASELRVAAIVAIGYGVLELVEGTGLWLDQLWAEYLTVIATSLLLPFELYELVHRPSVWKAAGIVVNLGIVAYLAYLLRRRVRGPRMLEPKTSSERLDEVSP
jgi:uncharacterized membrane protein (DUF2068 family)